MLGRKSSRRPAVHVAKLLRPAQPAGSGPQGRTKVPIERIEASVHLQRNSAGGDKVVEGPRPLARVREMPIAKISIQQRENFKFEVRHAAIIDPFAVAQLA